LDHHDQRWDVTVKRLAIRVVIAALVAVAGCGSSGPNQQEVGTRSGQDFVRIWNNPDLKVPTLTPFVTNFNAWAAGQLRGNDLVLQYARSVGMTGDPAPSKPLSPEARKAAAAVALQYVQHATSTKYGPLNGGYVVAYSGQKLVFRCKAPGDPPSDLCKSPQWQSWQAD
jgi:hypothetical protein